ncbi:DUF2922 domain-containing protein [Lactobacillus sp. XV13L]|nr:DUF2922 domain-containing protein [Lactobacillus sp. XV13L]
MTTTTSLQLVFLNGRNRKVNLSLPDAAPDLEATAVKAAMAKIAGADAFEKDGVDVYKVPKSAAYVERTVTSVFDDTADQPS